MADDQAEWLKLPTDEKCIHKAWKARMAGYEEAIKLFQTADEKSPEFSKYLGLIKKFVTDSNAIAQEKGLDAALAFVENAAMAPRTVGEVSSGVITKCLNASRAKTKERGIDILMMYIEIEKPDVVQEELIKGLSNKQPKIVAGCVQVLRYGLRDFGSKVMPIKPLVKLIQKLLEDRDKNVREESKLLVVEMYRWAGPALKPQLANLKPVQLTELEAEFDKLPAEKPQQVRFMRSQQDLKAKLEEQAAAAASGGGGDDGGAEDEDDGPAEMDPYELATAVDVLNKLPKDFYEQIEAKKWQERKEMLEAVHKLVDTIKIEPGDYGDLVRALKKVVSKDTNVMLVTLAAKCLTGLANGLRKKFAPYASQCTTAIIEKFKEKKVTVVAALREAIDAIYPSTNLEAISEDLIEALANKNPQIKAESAFFLARCFTKATPSTLNKKLLKMFCTPLSKTINDTVPDVRENSFQALGTAMKVVGEKPITPFIADVDSIKLTKIKECCEKAELVNMKSRNKPAASAAPPAAKPATSAPPPKAGGPPKSGGPAKSAAVKKTGPAKKAGPSKAGKSVAKSKTKGGATEEVSEAILSDDSVEEKAGSHLPADSLAGLANSNWKERLAAMEKFESVVKGMSSSDIPTQAFVRTINKKPGLKDTNFQVLKLRLDLIRFLAENSKFSKQSAEFVLSDIIDKVGDVKNGEAAKNALTGIAEATGLEHVSQEAIRLAFAQKNPKNQAEALNWLSQAVREFGFKVNVKPMIQSIKTSLAATNPAVRSASITLLGVLYMYMGGALRTLFESEKAAVLQLIDAEFDKVKDEKPPAPTRGLKGRSGDDADDDGDNEEDREEPEAVNVADLVPRNDIGDKITEGLLSQMGDKNWKERREALDKLTSILNEAGFITPNVGGLPEALKARLGDSNKLLVTTTLTIYLTLSNSMGPNIKKYVPVIGPALVNCCGDSKPQVRAAAVLALDALCTQTTLAPFMEPEILSDALKQEMPNLRMELLKWLATKLPTHKKLSSELALCIPHVYKCLEDRNADVRKYAKEALTPFMIHTGFDAFNKALGTLKPSSKDQIKPLIDKAREELPAKPTKSKPASTRPATAPAASMSPVDEADNTSPESTTSRPATAKAKAGSSKPAGKGKAGVAKPATKKKKDDEEDLGPAISVTTTKEQRVKDEKNMKVLKWNFTAPRAEFVEQLRSQMEPNFSKTVIGQLFHADFKFHIKAIETLLQALSLREATTANLDLILKWFTLRFFDTNPSMLNKAMDYLQKLFCQLSQDEYHMNELEANAFIPYLVLKVGENKDNVRRDVRTIFKLMCKVYPASKMFNHIINGLACKNTKQKTECLEELGSLIEIYGINVCQPSPAQALKLIAQQIGERDNSVRSAALNTCVAAYLILGEGVYKYIGNLNDKDQAMLEERIKRSSKSRPNSGVPAGKTPLPDEKQSAPKRERSQDDIKKPQSNMKAQSQREKRRTFALDIDDEGDVTVAMAPELVHHDLDDLQEPVHIPETRMRPPSPSFNLVNASKDASSAIDLVISQVTSIDIATSIQALGQIDALLKDTEKSSMLSSHVDQLLLTTSVQLRMAYSKHMSSPSTTEEDVLRLYRCLLATLMSLFQTTSLAKEASKDVLTDLIQNLVTILLDIRLNNMDEGPQVVRSVNVTVVKIIDRCDCTQVLRALIKLQHDCVGSETYSKKYLELIMKCIWKMIRILPNTVGELNIDQVLLDAHKFLEAFPVEAWRDKASDTPLRTIKTLLHTLAKLKGQKIMNHLKLINDAENSDVYHYLTKVLKSSGLNSAVSAANNKNEQMNSADEPASPQNKTPRRLNRSTHDQLAEIFKKVGSKENTREGLNALYDFKKKNPDADLEPYLRKSSQFFQTYIERGLKNIELERDTKMNTELQGGMSRVDSAPVMTGGQVSADFNPSQYMERLKVLRARCGLDNKGKMSEEKSDQSIKQDVVNPEVSMLGHHAASMPVLSSGGPQTEVSDKPAVAVDVADLKKRLERIKKGGL